MNSDGVASMLMVLPIGVITLILVKGLVQPHLQGLSVLALLTVIVACMVSVLAALWVLLVIVEKALRVLWMKQRKEGGGDS